MGSNTPFGKNRFKRALDVFQSLLKHKWMQELMKKSHVKILELCAGAGLGGGALAKALESIGIKCELILTDICGSLLNIAKAWVPHEIRGKVNVFKLDACNAYSLKDLIDEVDIILMYEYSTPHIKPRDMLPVLAGSAMILADNGLLIIHECDRIWELITREFERVSPGTVTENKALLNLRLSYDPIEGTIKVAVVDIFAKNRPAIMELHYWYLSVLLTLFEIFFKEVNFIPLSGDRHVGLILGRRPRKMINIEEFCIFRIEHNLGKS